MTLYTKIIRGDNLRKSRLHDEKGNFVGLKKLLLHGPRAIVTGLLLRTLGYQPELPWLPYTAIKYLKFSLNQESRVLEFGSGMSTIWFSKNAKEVFSVEDNLIWYEKLANIIEKNGLTNVYYKYAEGEGEYSTFMSQDKEGFDLIVIDGSYRSKCLSHAIKLIKSCGIIYLDNSDKDSTHHGGDMRIAESQARSFALASKAQVIEFTDFAPAQFFVQQSLLVKLLF